MLAKIKTAEPVQSAQNNSGQSNTGMFSLTVADPGRPVSGRRHLIKGALLVLFVLLLSPMALAAPERMMPSLESALAGHRAESVYLQTRMTELESHKSTVQNEISIYDSQGSAQGDLLLMPQIEREHLENALVNNRMVSQKLIERLRDLQEHYNFTLSLFKETAVRIELARKQMADIRQSQLPDAQKQKLTTTIRTLLEVLRVKKALADRYQQLYEDLIHRLNAKLEETKSLSEKLAARLKTHKKTALFSRTTSYKHFYGKGLLEAWDYSAGRLKALFSPAIWQTQWHLSKMGGFTRWAVFLLLFVSIAALQGRFRASLRRIENRWADSPDWYYSCLGLRLLRRSLLYLGMVLLFGIYSSVHLSLFDIGLGRAFFFVFLSLLLTRWGLDYLAFGLRGQPNELRSYVTLHLKWFLRFFCVATITSILLIWIAGRSNLLTWLTRNLVSAFSLAWALFFWRQIKAIVTKGVRIGQTAPSPKWMALCKWWSYILFGWPLLLNLSGYGQLANYWVLAWFATVAFLFWCRLLWLIIREWDNAQLAKVAAADTDQPRSIADELRWSLIQLVRLTWLVSLVVGLAWAWDSSGFLFAQLKRFTNATVVMGSLSLSVKGIVLAALILYLTRLVVYVGQSLINERILDKRSLEQGIKDSILTISSYLTWGLGLILALGILGVDATSLAVVFGALSVGIGFGLQTIFNNFISGLILLFERPIQVGDTIEVNGLLATVKKINVRATVVETFDNVSVIIPNSELISQQVTNLTLKDKWIRRSLEVGVAYGSDIDLVQKTLKEIVSNSHKVRKRPQSDVLFTEHADSALIFRLRIWVHLDDYWTVPSQIRCEIDSRFRELDIEIAFPQRDIHIRSTVTENSNQNQIIKHKIEDVKK